MVEDIVAGCGAYRVASGSRFVGGEREGGGDRQLGQVAEHTVELAPVELARDEVEGPEVG